MERNSPTPSADSDEDDAVMDGGTAAADGEGSGRGNPQYSAFQILRAADKQTRSDPVTLPREIASDLDTTTASIMRRLHRLVHAGYLGRKTVGAGAVALWLTDKGRDAVEMGKYHDPYAHEMRQYDDTLPEDTVDDSFLTRRPSREGRLGPLEPLELLNDAQGPVCTGAELAEAADLTSGAMLARLYKLYNCGFADRKRSGSNAIVWWLTDEGRRALNGEIKNAVARYNAADDDRGEWSNS